jgi:hypothetical protein
VSRARARAGLVVAGVVIGVGAVGVAVVEVLRLPKGSVWIVVAVTAAIVAAIRAATARR